MTIAGSMKTARLLRLLRVMRRIDQFSQYGAAVLVLMMIIFTLIAHWLACIFYAIAYVERPHLEFPTSWLDTLADKMGMPYVRNDTTSGPDIRSKYITAMYFTLTTLTSIGFGNVAPNTNAEKIFSIFAMMIGSLMSAAILGNVSSIMLRLFKGTEEYHERSESIKEFILFHTIPKTLADRLQDSFQHSWSYTNGIDMNQVLKSFPDCLQADICLHLNRNLLNNSIAFRGASPGCLRALSLKFRTTHAPPGDTLIHPGDILTAIYFIARGTIEVVKNDEVLAILGKDDIFGQNADDLSSVSKSNYSVRALTYCDLNKIELDDLEEILDTYPEFAKSFKKKFTITFNLKKGDFLQRTTPNKMDEETLKFIRQKQPRLQFKKSLSDDSESTAEKEFDPKPQRKISVTRQTQRPRVPDNLRRRSTVQESSDEEEAEIVELSPEKATVAYEPDVLIRRKNSMNSIAGALSSVISAVSGQRKKGPQSMQMRPLYPSQPPLQRGASVFSEARQSSVDHPQRGVGAFSSPLQRQASVDNTNLPSPRAADAQYLQPPYTSASASSSSSHIPKSGSNTTGPLSGHSPVDYDLLSNQPEKCSIRSFGDIDNRLEAINERMNNFENNLCSTVDAILEILGHKPQVVREQFLQRTSRPRVLFSDSLLTSTPGDDYESPSSTSEATVAQRSPTDASDSKQGQTGHLVKSQSETSGILKRY